jgi:hypothetical protein
MDVNFWGDWMNFMLWGMFLYECVLLRKGHLKGVSTRVFLNLRRMHECETSPSTNKQLAFDFIASFQFHRKEIFPWEHGNI